MDEQLKIQAESTVDFGLVLGGRRCLPSKVLVYGWELDLAVLIR